MPRADPQNKKPPRSGWLWDYGAPGEIRTPGPLIRSQVLYPAELRVHLEGGT